MIDEIAEKPPGRPFDAAESAVILARRREVKDAALRLVHAKEAAKVAKESYDGAVAALLFAIDEADSDQLLLPLDGADADPESPMRDAVADVAGAAKGVAARPLAPDDPGTIVFDSAGDQVGGVSSAGSEPVRRGAPATSGGPPVTKPPKAPKAPKTPKAPKGDPKPKRPAKAAAPHAEARP